MGESRAGSLESESSMVTAWLPWMWLAPKMIFHCPSHYPLDLYSTHMLFLIVSCILRDEVNDLFMAKHSAISYSKCCELYFWLSFGIALAFRYKYRCLETTLSIFSNNSSKIPTRGPRSPCLWILDSLYILGMNSFFWTCPLIQLERTVFYPHNSPAMIAPVDSFCC